MYQHIALHTAYPMLSDIIARLQEAFIVITCSHVTPLKSLTFQSSGLKQSSIICCTMGYASLAQLLMTVRPAH